MRRRWRSGAARCGGPTAGLVAALLLCGAAALAATPRVAATATAAADHAEVVAVIDGRWSASDGQRVAYVDPDGAIRLLDAWLNTSRVLAAGEPQPEEVRLAGDHMAFLRGAGRKELVTGPLDGPYAPVRETAGQLSPSLDADGTLAWVDTGPRPGTQADAIDVWLLQPGGSARPLTSDDAGQSEPVVRDGLVAWTDTRNTSPLPLLAGVDDATSPRAAHPRNLDVFVHDVAAGVTLPATDEPLEQQHPALGGGRLLYVSTEASGPQAFERVARDGTRGARHLVGDPAWRPTRVAADGGRAVVLEGPSRAAWLRVVDLADGRLVGDAGPFDGAITLSADAGVAAMDVVAPGGGTQVVVLRLPGPLRAVAHAAGAGCWTVTAQGAQGAVRAILTAPDGERRDLEPRPDGAFLACGAGQVRVVDAAGGSPPLDLAAPAKGSPGPGLPLAASALVAALLALRRQRRRR